MNLRAVSNILALFVMCILALGCFKKDIPITQLPPKTGSTIMQVQMGPQHDSTFYINLDSAKVIGKSLHYSWDLKFECAPNSHHIMLNSGKNTRALKTLSTDINAVTSIPSDSVWGYDAPTLTPDSTYIGNWYDANNLGFQNVYIIRLKDKAGNFTFKKIQFVRASATNYIIRFANLESTTATTLSIPKNNNYNFAFFAFDGTQHILEIEPPKTTWDVQITRFNQVYYNLNPIVVYEVNGMLHNNYNTVSACDTLNEKDYKLFNADSANAMMFYPWPNAIGFTWKNFSISQGTYIVYDKYIYAIRTQRNNLYKLRFLSYTTPFGESYAPKFEFERLK